MSDKCPKCGVDLDLLDNYDKVCDLADACNTEAHNAKAKLAVAERDHSDAVSEWMRCKDKLAVAQRELDAAIALLREVQAEAGNQSPVRHALTPSTRDAIDAFLAKH